MKLKKNDRKDKLTEFTVEDKFCYFCNKKVEDNPWYALITLDGKSLEVPTCGCNNVDRCKTCKKAFYQQ